MGREVGTPNRHWGDFASTSQLPNVSGATKQDAMVTIGDMASVLGEPYVCITSVESSASWKRMLRDGSASETGDQTITGALTVTGLATLSAAATVGTTLGVTGNLTVGASKLVVTAASGNTTVAGTLGVTGIYTPTGGIAPLAALTGVHNITPNVATAGTDVTPASGTQFVTSVFVPGNITVTKINYLIGSVGGTNKVYGVIYSNAGAVLANTDITGSPAGATVGTAANIQSLALVTPASLSIVGPTWVHVGISISGNTARIRCVPAFCQGSIWGATVSQTHGTVAAIAALTSFTADQAPYVFLS